MTTRANITSGPHIVSVPHTESRYLFKPGGRLVSDGNTSSPYVTLTDQEEDSGKTPDDLVPILTDFSQESRFEALHGDACREIGEYAFRSATATVTCYSHKGTFGSYIVTVRGPNLRDVNRLRRRIRAGTITPNMSYQRPQVKAGLPGLWKATQQFFEALARAYDNRRLV